MIVRTVLHAVLRIIKLFIAFLELQVIDYTLNFYCIQFTIFDNLVHNIILDIIFNVI